MTVINIQAIQVLFQCVAIAAYMIQAKGF